MGIGDLMNINTLKNDKRLKVGIAIALFIISFMMIYRLIASASRLYNRQQTYEKLTIQKTQLESEKKKLEKEVAELSDDDYVVRYARDHYIFSQEDEKVIILPEE